MNKVGLQYAQGHDTLNSTSIKSKTKLDADFLLNFYFGHDSKNSFVSNAKLSVELSKGDNGKGDNGNDDNELCALNTVMKADIP